MTGDRLVGCASLVLLAAWVAGHYALACVKAWRETQHLPTVRSGLAQLEARVTDVEATQQATVDDVAALQSHEAATGEALSSMRENMGRLSVAALGSNQPRKGGPPW